MSDAFHKQYFDHMVSGKKMPKWMGIDVVKYPTDLILYQEVLFKNKPDFLVETGTHKGGSALFFANMFDLIGHGQVISVDIKDHDPPKHQRITYIGGRATASDTLKQIKEMVDGKSVMVVLDSNHHRSHVKRELIKYGEIATKGQYLVVEDTNYRQIGKREGPDEAVEWYLPRTKKFRVEHPEKQFMLTLSPGGWLRRI